MSLAHFKILLPSLAMFLLAGIWSGYWFWLSTTLQHRITAHQETKDALPNFACQDQNWSGYPFRFTLTCRAGDATLTIAGKQIDWRIAAIDVTAQAYNLQHLVARHFGPAQIRVDGQKLVDYQHQQASSSHAYSKSKGTRHAYQAQNLAVLSAGHDIRIADLRLFHEAPPQSGRTRLALQAGTASFDLEGAGKFSLERAEIQLDVPGQDVQQIADLKALAARAEPISVTRLMMTAPGVRLTGTGDIRVTPSGHLDGSLQTRLEGVDAFLSLLAEAGGISTNQARNAATLLGVFKASAKNGALDINFIAKAGDLFWGPIHLGRHPPLF